MEIQGKLTQILPLQTGEGKNGTWKKQEFIIETSGQYPKKICISMWGDKINNALLQVGNELTAHIDIESREYNGRWYTEVKAWKIEGKTNNESASAPNFPPPTFDVPDEYDIDPF
ncbi:MAG: DUF3127 domain-containing protein [Bacteroidales bacterium]|nr:DUF3127 domain-containing protein [Bacteroidales bacterium]